MIEEFYTEFDNAKVCLGLNNITVIRDDALYIIPYRSILSFAVNRKSGEITLDSITDSSFTLAHVKKGMDPVQLTDFAEQLRTLLK